MAFLKMVSVSVLMLALGCGAQNQQDTAASQQPKTVPADMPKMLIAKVPVDAEGKEIDDLVETREVNAVSSVADADSAAEAFEQAEVVSVANELDADTSSQQWGSSRGMWWWNTPWYPGKLLGRGLWWGRNPYLTRNNCNYGYQYRGRYNHPNQYNYYTYYPNY